MFIVGGSYARLFAGKALILLQIQMLTLSFFALQHNYGFIQSIYRAELEVSGKSKVLWYNECIEL